MDWTLNPEEWSLLAAAAVTIVVLGLSFAFGVRHRLAWSQLPAAARDGELTTLVAAREAELLDLECQKKALEEDIHGLESRILERDRLAAEAEHWEIAGRGSQGRNMPAWGPCAAEVEQVRGGFSSDAGEAS